MSSSGHKMPLKGESEMDAADELSESSSSSSSQAVDDRGLLPSASRKAYGRATMGESEAQEAMDEVSDGKATSGTWAENEATDKEASTGPANGSSIIREDDAGPPPSDRSSLAPSSVASELALEGPARRPSGDPQAQAMRPSPPSSVREAAPLLQLLQSAASLPQGAAGLVQQALPSASAGLEQLAAAYQQATRLASASSASSALQNTHLPQQLAGRQRSSSTVLSAGANTGIATSRAPSAPTLSLLQLLQLAPLTLSAAPELRQVSQPSILEQVAAAQASQGSGSSPQGSAALFNTLQQQLLASQRPAPAERTSLDASQLDELVSIAQLASAAGLQQGPRQSTLPTSIEELQRLELLVQNKTSALNSPRAQARVQAPPAAVSSSVPLAASTYSPAHQMSPQILQSLLQQLHDPQRAAPSHPPPPSSSAPQAPILSVPTSILLGLVQEISTLRAQVSALQRQNEASIPAVSIHSAASLEPLLQHANTGSRQDTKPAAASASTPGRGSGNTNDVPAPDATRKGLTKSNESADSTAREQTSGPIKSKEKRWMKRYEELKLFRRVHGHCRVPHGYHKNPKLSWWVMNQRAQYQSLQQGKKNWLTEDRIRLLNDIAFDWSPIVKKTDD